MTKYSDDIEPGIRYFIQHTTIPSIICFKDVIVATNEPMVNLLGFGNEKQLLNKAVTDFVNPEFQQPLAHYLQAVNQTDPVNSRPGHRVEIKLRLDNGRNIYVELTAMPVMWKSKPSILINTVDISERKILKKKLELLKRSEKTLLESEEQSRIRIHEEIEKGRQQERLLMQHSKLVTMGEMVAAIAHQWRQPLTAIGFIVQNIETAYQRNMLNEKYLSMEVKDAMRQIKFMSKTIDGFRNFFITSEDKGSFDVIRIIEESLSLLHAQLDNSYIYVKINKPESRSLISSGYPIEFKQVILNIINNAKNAIASRSATKIRKARSAPPSIKDRGTVPTENRGAVPIEKNEEEQRGLIIIDISSLNEEIIIKIWNNGVFIPEDDIGRIFEPFYTSSGKGMGIGLYMSKVIIEKNGGGRIYAENKGDGVLFTIHINKCSHE